MNTTSPLVSVIMPVYNGERFLAEAIEGVLGQTYRAWELVVVDDGSSDSTAEIAAGFAGRHPHRIRVVRHPGGRNRGISASRNLGFRHARGELVAHLDSDDVWSPEKLERQVTLLGERPEAGLVFGRPLYWSSWAPGVDASEDTCPPLPVPAGRPLPPPEALLTAHPLGPGTAPCPSDLLVRRETMERVGGFEESFTGAHQLYEDQAFLAKVYLAFPVLGADECWTRYRLHEDSCMVRVRRAGGRDEARRFFLEWLEGHLRRAGVREPRVRRALGRALRPYRHPHLHRLQLAAREPGPTLGALVKGGLRRAVPERFRRPVLSWLRRWTPGT